MLAHNKTFKRAIKSLYLGGVVSAVLGAAVLGAVAAGTLRLLPGRGFVGTG